MHKVWSGQRVFTFDQGDGSYTVSDGDQDILEVNYPDAKGLRWEQIDACYLCGRVYHRSELVYYNGKGYCIPRGCYKDIEQLKERETGYPVPEHYDQGVKR